jgi:hypothetical protein
MHSLNIDKIITECVFNNNSNLREVTLKILHQCNTLQKLILKDQKITMIKILFEFVYILNYLYKSIGLLQIINPTPEIFEIDNIVSKYYNDFFSNIKIHTHINKIKNAITDKIDLLLIDKILLNLFRKQDVDVNKFTSTIDKIKQKINNILNDTYNMDTSGINTYIANIPPKIILNRQSYYYLQKKIKDPVIRNKIEVEYFKKSDKCLELLEKLIIERHKYASYMKCDSYFNFIKQKSLGESEDIKSLINDLIVKIDGRSKKEIERIKRELIKDGYDKKVDLCDIIFYHEKLKTKHVFSPEKAINVIFECIKKYFGVTFLKNNEHLNMCENNYTVLNSNNEKIGIIYFDLQNRNNKKVTSPLSLHLCHKYENLDGAICLTKMVLLSGYENIKKQCMTYSDVIYLFREFGHILQTLSYSSSKNGMFFCNGEFNILFPQIMEYIAWEKNTVEKMCTGLDKTVVDHILFMRYIDFSNAIKLRCINALFDHIIHNSPDLIQMLIDNNLNGNLLKVLYKKIYKDVMSSQQNILNMEITGINPTVIQQEINGSEGIIYGNILTEILSFGIYNIIKTGKGISFFNNTLNVESTKIKKSLYDFISTHSTDSYDLYLQEVIGYSEIDTDVNIKEKENFKNTNAILTDSSVNHFGEDSDESDNDSNNIIHIDRKFNF